MLCQREGTPHQEKLSGIKHGWRPEPSSIVAQKIMQDTVVFVTERGAAIAVYQCMRQVFKVDQSSLSGNLIWAWYNYRLEVILCLSFIKGSPLNLSFNLVKWCQEDEKRSLFHTNKLTLIPKINKGCLSFVSKKTVVSGGQLSDSVVPHRRFWKRRTYLLRDSFFPCVYRNEHNFLNHLLTSLEPGSTARMKMNHLFSSWNNWFCNASGIPHFSFIF